ncbi:MAG: sensor histidine kinase, partial [Actinomycetota bacterium]
IARELHDIVAHSMSVMVVQAGAARRVLETDPQQAEQALAAIEETGRGSLTEMRRVLGILRTADDVSRLSPQPTLDDFRLLVDGCREAGVRVDMEISGQQRPLAAGLELAVFRIVQEALTNVVKHSAADEAQVRLTYGATNLEVAVYDAGRGAAANSATPGGGNGLVGMRERVELFDGKLVTGPRPGGGYQVVATLPTTPRNQREQVPV